MSIKSIYVRPYDAIDATTGVPWFPCARELAKPHQRLRNKLVPAWPWASHVVHTRCGASSTAQDRKGPAEAACADLLLNMLAPEPQ